MWYAVVVWWRNLMYDSGLFRCVTVPVTTIGVGNLCVGGAGKTPQVEYLLRLLSGKYPTALLSRGYRRCSRGFQLDDGSHSVQQLGDEPAMVARKFPEVRVAVCKDRVEGINRLMEDDRSPRVVILDDVYQYRKLKTTLTILLTEYNKPFYRDKILPFGDLREPYRRSRRADIVIVSKAPEKLNPMDAHAIIDHLELRPCQKIFFSYIHYNDPVPIGGGDSVKLTSFGTVLLLTGIAHSDEMVAYVRKHCGVKEMILGDHHAYSASDIRIVRNRFAELKADNKAILTTEKDAVKLLELGNELLEELPIFTLPIEVRIHQQKDYVFDDIVQKAVEGNVSYLHQLNNR